MATDFLVNIDVPDLAAGMQFYCDGLGLRVGRKFDGIVELLGGPAPIYLLTKGVGSAAVPSGHIPRSYARHWTPVHLDFITGDVDAAVAQALSAGALLERPVRTERWGRIALLADPFGNGFCLIEFVGRGYDELLQPGAG